MKRNVESALFNCGRDRVMSREGCDSASVAIRLDPVRMIEESDTERFLVREGATLDEAGRDAAKAYAERLIAAAKRLTDQAGAIIAALGRE